MIETTAEVAMRPLQHVYRAGDDPMQAIGRVAGELNQILLGDEVGLACRSSEPPDGVSYFLLSQWANARWAAANCSYCSDAPCRPARDLPPAPT